MAGARLRKVSRYGDQFKATAVKLSNLPGVLIQDVVHALDIHPLEERGEVCIFEKYCFRRASLISAAACWLTVRLFALM